MPTVIEYLGLKFKINANDHNPPHVHVEGRGCSVRISLKSIKVMSIDGFSRSDLKRILEVVRFYQKELMGAWNEYHK